MNPYPSQFPPGWFEMTAYEQQSYQFRVIAAERVAERRNRRTAALERGIIPSDFNNLPVPVLDNGSPLKSSDRMGLGSERTKVQESTTVGNHCRIVGRESIKKDSCGGQNFQPLKG